MESVGNFSAQRRPAPALVPNSTLLQAQCPRTPEDVSRTVRYICAASPSRLPAELLKMILYYADYDCIHFRAHADQSVKRGSTSSDETPRAPYIETEPLKFLLPASSARAVSGHGGRVRAVRLQATGRDQGWGGDATGSWSWFEVASRPSTSTGMAQQHISEGLKWAQNEVASEHWQQHEVDTMARFPGWSCTASNGSIDVEVEIWR